jgi:hypothetical protein
MSATVPLRELRYDPNIAAPPPGPGRGQGIVPAEPLHEHPVVEDLLPATTFRTTCDAPPSTTTSTQGEAPFASVSVELLFWGSQWQSNPKPTIALVKSACAQIIEGSYLLGLGQYGVAPGRLVGSSIVTNFPPPNPVFDGNVQLLLANLAFQGLLNLQNLNMVVVPANIPTNNPAKFTGLHSVLGTPIGDLYYGWITHNGTLPSLTQIFSHELAEACTDRGGGGIQVNPRNPTNWNEICDVCCSNAPLNGLLVNSYWSQQSKACILPIPYTATAKSQLTCFGVNGENSRVYYLAGRNLVNELAYIPGWQNNVFNPAAADTALACFGSSGTDSRVYYLDAGHHVNELAFANGWQPPLDITAKTGAAAAAAGSDIACFGVGGQQSRVYYQDSKNLLNEMAYDQNKKQFAHNALGVAAAPGSRLACFGHNGTDSRVYYLDSNNHVMELPYINGFQKPIDITKQTGAPPAAKGSDLACFGVNGQDSRVYYQDAKHQVNEMAWDKNKKQFAHNPLNVLAAAGSALACFGVNGTDSRVYYLTANGHLMELPYINGFQAPIDTTSKSGGPTAAKGSDLACFGVDGQATRVYYFDANRAVNEMAYDNGTWVNHLL